MKQQASGVGINYSADFTQKRVVQALNTHTHSTVTHAHAHTGDTDRHSHSQKIYISLQVTITSLIFCSTGHTHQINSQTEDRENNE